MTTVHSIPNGKPEEKPTTTIIIDSEEIDDWMKSLPGYEDEIKIHEELANKLIEE
jgi:hypothetical protein